MSPGRSEASARRSASRRPARNIPHLGDGALGRTPLMPAPGKLRAAGQRPAHHGGADGGGVFAARVVVGHEDRIRRPGSSPPHGLALGKIALPPRPEHSDKLAALRQSVAPLGEAAEARRDGLGRMREIHQHLRALKRAASG